MRWSIALCSVLGLCACNSADDDIDPESYAGCYDRVSERIGAELAEFDAQLSSAEDLRWVIEIEITERTAMVTMGPISPSLRGGGGRYNFDCEPNSSGELIFVEGYR
jgi:hypothetical protein